MQIVIDIPDEEYKRLVYIDMLKLREYIENGTPLPKGHGDLKDIDAINLYEEDFYDGSDYVRAIDAINDAPTIIEADKETSGCSSCPYSGSIIDGYVDCPDAYTKQSQYCGLNNREE